MNVNYGGGGETLQPVSELKGIYIKKDEAGREYIKRVYDVWGYQIEVITGVTETGEIRHQIIFDETYDANEFIVKVDTQLGEDDRVPLYANGSGNIYMEDEDIKVIFEGLDDTQCILGGPNASSAKLQLQSMENSPFSAFGKEAGEVLMDGSADSAMYFLSGLTSVSKGDKLIIGYQERLMPKKKVAPPPSEKQNGVTVSHVDKNGNKIKGDIFVAGEIGDEIQINTVSGISFNNETYTFEKVTGTSGYTATSVGGNMRIVLGVAEKNQQVTIHYKNIKDSTEDDSTGDDNTGDDNTGDDNTGDDNTGDDNTGDDKTPSDNKVSQTTDVKSGTPAKTATVSTSKPKTGDTNLLVVYLALGVMSAGIATVVLAKKRKKQK
jgi:LPXTG-motif cell wall-anchored protein